MEQIYPSQLFNYEVVGVKHIRGEDSASAFIKEAVGVFKEFEVLLSGDPNIKEPGFVQIQTKLNTLDGVVFFTTQDEMIQYFYEEVNVAANLKRFFHSSTDGDACLTPDLSPYTVVKYHDGAGSFPTIGDTVYDDFQGNTPSANIGAGNKHFQMADLAYLQTDANGVVTPIICK